MGGRNRLDFSLGAGIDLILVSGSNMTWFRVWVEINLIFGSGASKLTCFLCGGQNSHRFSLRAENYLVMICISELTWFLSWGYNLTWFLCAGRE